MAWPSTRVSPEPWGRRAFDDTLLGRFYVRGAGHYYNLFGGQNSSTERVEVLKSLDFFNTLPPDVIVKLAGASYSDIRRLIYTWRGIEDSILLSTPELVNQKAPRLLLKLWKWCICTFVHSYDKIASEWKRLTLHLKHKAGATAEQGGNPFPRSMPGSLGGTFGPLWKDALPWLRIVSIHATFPVAAPLSTRCVERVGILVQTRMLPPPPLNERRFEKEVLKWRDDLTRVPTWNSELEREVRHQTTNICQFIKNVDGRVSPRPHVSLTSSGCFNNPRKEGGRAVIFMQRFLDEYVKKPSTENSPEGLTTWWGAPYVFVKGVPRFYTMCRSTNLSTEVPNFLHSSFLDEMHGGSLMALMFGMGTSIEEPMFGLDEALPDQFFQMAIELCVEAGYMPGPVFWDLPSAALAAMDFKPQRVVSKAHPVCEPGNKVRWVTMEEDFVTVALQPLAHWMSGILKYYPSLVSAFSRSWKGWDIACILQTREEGHSPNFGFGTFDLTGASNNLNKLKLRSEADTFIRYFTEPGPARVTLLRLLEMALLDREIRVYDSEDSSQYRVIHCTNGVLMGNPITKELLVLSSAVIHAITHAQMRRQCSFNLIAGDDIFVYSTYKFYTKLLANHRRMGNVINQTKSTWSKSVVFFTEEVLRLVPSSIGCGKRPDQCDYSVSLHPDIIKLRLLSPFGIQSTMQDSSYKNPAIGKGSALSGMLDWHPRKDVAWIARRRFLRWMSNFIGDDPLVYLPRYMGGHSIPWVKEPRELFLRIISESNLQIVSIWREVYDPADTNLVLSFLIRRMATGNTVRGLIDPLQFRVSADYTAAAMMAKVDEMKTWQQMEEEVQEKFSPIGRTVRNRDILRHIQSKGLMSPNDVADLVDRLTAIRIAFQVADGQFSIEDVHPQRDSALPLPGEVLEKFIKDELSSLKGISLQGELEFRQKDLARFEAWIGGGMKRPRRGPGSTFIPRNSVTDSLNGMTIGIPYTGHREIPGRVGDPNLLVSMEWRSVLMYLNRRKI